MDQIEVKKIIISVFCFKIIIIFETQLPHHNIKNLNQFRLKMYLPVVVQSVYLNYRIEHRLILRTNN